jgi:hypothetical protein
MKRAAFARIRSYAPRGNMTCSLQSGLLHSQAIANCPVRRACRASGVAVHHGEPLDRSGPRLDLLRRQGN